MKPTTHASFTKITSAFALRATLTLAIVLIAGCGRHLSGTYTGEPDAHFEKLTFKSGGKVELSFMGSISEATYALEGDRVKISAGGMTQIFTLDKQGCLDGGGIVGKYCKK